MAYLIGALATISYFALLFFFIEVLGPVMGAMTWLILGFVVTTLWKSGWRFMFGDERDY